MKKQNVKLSKFLSYVLRHKPESIGLTLDDEGWADLDELIECAARHGKRLDRTEIFEVVANNDKQRFSLGDHRSRIRANQGHSIAVNLRLQVHRPPDRLFHGTATRFLDSIMRSGVHSRSRQHVHLSADTSTAKKVGMRHGIPVVLAVDAIAMADAGTHFYLSDNGVWLVGEVPPQYLSVVEETEG